MIIWVLWLMERIGRGGRESAWLALFTLATDLLRGPADGVTAPSGREEAWSLGSFDIDAEAVSEM